MPLKRFDVSAGNALTLMTIIISVATFYLSWSREREFSRRSQADQVRIAAASSISKIERWKEISLTFFDEIQSVFVEASEIVVKDPEKFNIVGSRDYLWKEINRARIATKRHIVNENIENAYSSLIAYYPGSRSYFREIIDKLNLADREMFEKVLNETQRVALSFDGKSGSYSTAQMGNALRWSTNDAMREFEGKIDPIIADVVAYLSSVIDKDDTMLILNRSDNFMTAAGKIAK